MTRCEVLVLRFVSSVLSALMAVPSVGVAQGSTQQPVKSLRVVIAGLVHGHASGFLERNQKRPDLEIVGIAEPRRELFDQYAKKFNLHGKLYYADLDDAIEKTHPDACP